MDPVTLAFRLILWAVLAVVIHGIRDKDDWATDIFIAFIIVSALSGYGQVATIAQS